jgi:ElaB/YqjD/DUF883 family membrane-anchored ribosome-binding protein
MPRRDPELPEGTDRIVDGAAATEGGKGGAFVARPGDSAREAGERLVSQVKDQVATLRDQAGGRIRTYADDGKGRATDLLDDISGVIGDAARSIDERLGREYGDYAHRASTAVSNLAGKVRERSVDDLLDDTRDIVRKSPAVAIAAAAVVGFALMRLFRTGLDDVGATSRRKRGSDGDES